MPERLQIVCYGRDQALQHSRKMVLLTRFRTEVAGDLKTLSAKLASPGCDLVILCHSLSVEFAQQACDLVRATSPATKILVLITGRTKVTLSPCPAEFLATEGPGALLGRVSQMLGVAMDASVDPPGDEAAPAESTPRRMANP